MLAFASRYAWAMSLAHNPSLQAIFYSQETERPRALMVAGCCGNVGFGKLGQFARQLIKVGIPIVALDTSPQVHEIPERLSKALSERFSDAEIRAILDHIILVQGGPENLPSGLEVGMVFEAIPERLDVKQAFYQAVRARYPKAYLFSATSGFTSKKLFSKLANNQRCGVLHPFFPHLTNKLWEMPWQDAVTSPEVCQTVTRFLAALGMTVVPVRDVSCFVADRLFCGMMAEAVRCHEEVGITPAQVDDVCQQVLGTSPFFVHNLIRGANGLSAHCMQLLSEELNSSLYRIADAWRPYIKDPDKKWPYERGQKCPEDKFEVVKNRMLGMLFTLTAEMIEHDMASVDAINFLAEKALAFRLGPPALIESMGFAEARHIARQFVRKQKITLAQEAAPLWVLDEKNTGTFAGWQRLYVDYKEENGVGVLNLKRSAINHLLIHELDRAYEILQGDPQVKAIVIIADGWLSADFGHGADLHCFVPVLGKRDAALSLIQTWKRTLGKFRRGKPTVAALTGRALGGSLELATSCHARVAAQGCKLAQPETIVGVIPGLGGCHQIHRSSQSSAFDRINELLLTGESFSAEEAMEWGFVQKVVSSVDVQRESSEFALALAEQRIPMPTFIEGAQSVEVCADVKPTNEKGVVLDQKLRELLVQTIRECNQVPFAEASQLEEQRAADSLCMSASRIGVAALLKGKAPQFEYPLPLVSEVVEAPLLESLQTNTETEQRGVEEHSTVEKIQSADQPAPIEATEPVLYAEASSHVEKQLVDMPVQNNSLDVQSNSSNVAEPQESNEGSNDFHVVGKEM